MLLHSTVVNPQLTLSFDPEMPAVGEPFSGTCRVSIDPAVSGMILLEWRNQNNAVISSGTGTTTAETSFTIDEVTLMDNTLLGGYSCQATISARDGTTQYNITLARSIIFQGVK